MIYIAPKSQKRIRAHELTSWSGCNSVHRHDDLTGLYEWDAFSCFNLDVDLDSTGIQVDDRDGFKDSMLEVKVKATGLQGQVQGQWCLRPFRGQGQGQGLSLRMHWATLRRHSICFELPPLLPPRLFPSLTSPCWLCSSSLYADDLDLS